jgi:hypothetical protein
MRMTVDTSRAKKKAAKLKKMPEATGRTLVHFAGQVIKRAKRNATGGIVGKYKWGKKTGALGRNVGHKLERRADIFQLMIGTGTGLGKSSVKYANILDKGGIIKAKNAPYLAIPMPDGSLRLKKQVRIPEFKWFRRSVQEELHLLNALKLKNDILKEMKL